MVSAKTIHKGFRNHKAINNKKGKPIQDFFSHYHYYQIYTLALILGYETQWLRILERLLSSN